MPKPRFFPLAKLAVLVGLTLSLGMALAQSGQSTDLENGISTQIGKLRSVPDAERGDVTKSLALQIRALPKGIRKVGLASSLANLSTEGDFGHDTLQEVATTLALALEEEPVASKNGEPAPYYFQLAQLARYERVKVALKGPEYAAAVAKVAALEKTRGKVDFTLNDLSGKPWTLSALKGKVVLVNMWATWCPPCRKEMPDLDALYKRFKDKGFVILAISDEEAKTVSGYLAQHPVSYPVLLDPGRKVNEQYQVDGIPKSFIYDRKGKLVAQSIDMRTQGQFLELLSRAGLK